MKLLKNRIVTVIICLLMLVSLVPVSAAADEIMPDISSVAADENADVYEVLTDEAADVDYLYEETVSEAEPDIFLPENDQIAPEAQVVDTDNSTQGDEGQPVSQSDDPESQIEDTDKPDESSEAQDGDPGQQAGSSEEQDDESGQQTETSEIQDDVIDQQTEMSENQEDEPAQQSETSEDQGEDPEQQEDTLVQDEKSDDPEEETEEDADLELAAVPGINSAVSAKNALAILKAYDSEGYYIVNYMSQYGESIDFWLMGSSSNAAGLDTAVHEVFHSYTHTKGAYRKQAIYLGNGRDIYVDSYPSGVNIFPTSTWAETLPSNLRTFRFSTYVSKSSSASANSNGPYGLLNEFAAYCWGMHDQLALFPYYKSQGNSMNVWGQFVAACGNDRQAYAEFRFWILGYLNYAKNNNSAVYQYIINDRDFCDAYFAIKNKFESQIKTFNARCDEIVSLAAADGINAYFSGDYFWFGYNGRSTNYSEYSLLMDELSKSQYKNVEAALYAGSSDGSYKFAQKNGVWGWYEDGTLQTDMTGLVKGTINGTTAWYYIKNGIFTDTTGLAQRADGSSNAWYFVKNGVYTKATGMAQSMDGSDSWYYVKNGTASRATGITQRADGADSGWYYVENGVFTKATGIAKLANGANNKWYYVEDGVCRKATGLTRRADGSNNSWYYVKSGVYTKTTTAAKRLDGANDNWYFVYKGSWVKYTGTITLKGTKYRVVNGVLQ